MTLANKHLWPSDAPEQISRLAPSCRHRCCLLASMLDHLRSHPIDLVSPAACFSLNYSTSTQSPCRLHCLAIPPVRSEAR